MDAADQYFTTTIVGAPLTVPLGRPTPRAALPATLGGGVSVDLRRALPTLTERVRDWLLLDPQATPGQAWRRPGAVRRWLIRHSLWVAALGWGLALALLAREHGPAWLAEHAPALSAWVGDELAPRVVAALDGLNALLAPAREALASLLARLMP